MERIISADERIRRAEEIYQRRRTNNSDVRVSSSQVTDGKEKRQYSLYKKMILQVLICVLIYLIFSLVKEANYLFSDNVLNKTKDFLSTDINFEVLSGQVNQFFKDNKDKFGFLTNWLHEDDIDNQQENQIMEQNQQNVQDNQTGQGNEEQGNKIEGNTQTNETAGIGGGSDDNKTVAASSDGDTAKKTQMELDAEYIKKNFSIGLPAKATITSRYGKRESNEIVSANHQGIDIGVTVGTTIVAAIDGTVSVVSDEGEYGTHVKIVNKDITTIYAHCSKILVKEGAKVKKGEKIALSGNTGKTTGPHLHFEIRRADRTINPELVLNWK